MTPEQLQHFSADWQAYFESLRGQGYTVTYAGGVIHIRNSKYRMTSLHERGRWIIVLEKPFGEPDVTSSEHDRTAIGRIENFLIKANRNPLVYSFAIRVPVPLAAGAEKQKKGAVKRDRKSRKNRNHRR